MHFKFFAGYNLVLSEATLWVENHKRTVYYLILPLFIALHQQHEVLLINSGAFTFAMEIITKPQKFPKTSPSCVTSSSN